MISASNEQLQQELEYTLLKPDCHGWWISKIQSGREEERYEIKFCFKFGKNAMWWKLDLTDMTQRSRDRVPSWSMLTLPDPDRVNPPTDFWWSLFWQHWHDLHALGSHWTDSQQGILCWGFKGVQGGGFRRKRPALFKSDQWHFDQDNAPVHNSILVTDYLSKMGIKTLPRPP